MTDIPHTENKTWRESFAVYLKPNVLNMLFLGFSAGLPFLLVFGTWFTWLKDIEIDIVIIGYLSWVGITYSIKVFWAPIIDALDIPWLTKTVGHRRSWMLIAQVGIATGLIGMSLTDPMANLWIMIWFALLVAFSSATQDVSIDAYRIEVVSYEYQAAMASTYMMGYRLALLAAGAGALYIADFASWQLAYISMAVLVGVGITTTLIIKEPSVGKNTRQLMPRSLVATHIKSFTSPVRMILIGLITLFFIMFLVIIAAAIIVFPFLLCIAIYLFIKYRHTDLKQRLTDWCVGAIVGPFVDFFYRFSASIALLMIFLILTFRVSDIFMGGMAQPLYLDLGFSKSEIATYSKVFGIFMTIFGTLLGGVLVMRLGIMRSLLVGAILVALANLLFAYLAYQGKSATLLAIVIACDNISAGLATAAFIAYLSSLVNKAYTATQYALFSSLMTLPGKVISGFAGEIVAATSFSTFFLYASAAGLPAIALVMILIQLKHDPKPAEAKPG